MLQQLGEHPPLIVGNDPVADAGQRERLPIGRHCLDHEDHGGDDGEDDDPGEVLVDIGLIDHVADQIGTERRAGCGDPHEAERERVAAPLPRRLFHQEPPDQAGRAAGVGKHPLEIRSKHTPPVARRPGARGAAERPSCPGSSGFQAESARFQEAGYGGEGTCPRPVTIRRAPCRA